MSASLLSCGRSPLITKVCPGTSGHIHSCCRWVACLLAHPLPPLPLLSCTVLHCCPAVLCAADELREFRDTIVSMLDTYSYERSILQTATALLNADKYMQIERLAAKHASAFSARADYCEACHLPLSDGSITLRITIFDCQHAFHDSCLRPNTTSCPLCQQQTQSGGKKQRKDTPNRPITDGQHSGAADSSTQHDSKEDNGETTQHSNDADKRKEDDTTSKVATQQPARHIYGNCRNSATQQLLTCDGVQWDV